MTFLRKVTEKDCHELFLMANDPDIRVNSLNSKPIEWEEHVKWFHSKIASPNSRYLVLVDSHNCILGQIRFDKREEEDTWILSYSIKAEFRGQGFGKEIVRKALGHCSFSEKITALVKPDNLASISVFSKLGFTRSEVFINGSCLIKFVYHAQGH